MSDRRSGRGIALVVVIMAMLVIGALGVALLLGGTSETLMAGNFLRSAEAQYAAEAALERGLPEVSAATDWSSILAGSSRSSFVDGPPGGIRHLAGGTDVDLSAVVNIANCGRSAACTEADLASLSAERPWGMNSPRWALYAYGQLATLMPPGTTASQYYLVLLVGDDPAENDDQPTVDGGPPLGGEARNPGADVLVFRAEAFGPRGAHARIDATLVRNVGLVSWRLVR